MGAAALLPLVGSTPGISSKAGSGWADCCVRDPRAAAQARGISGNQERAPHVTSVTIVTVGTSGGPCSCRWQQCAAGKADSAFSGTCEEAISAAAPCTWWTEASCCDARELCSAEDTAKAPLPGTATAGAPSSVAGSPRASTQPALPGGPSSRLPAVPRR
ncbi:PREDICTED: polycystic kidney disease protein 1-like 1 [Chinchilla lanigera]|uniref:polycystic kidney disease protein 1-like 1 n=1 Tax=Chinchilla lanigera TaxID=34839 RepID=UPI0006983439|nr:PREDICTED: polycystic kidney disease protein 1-like 1 [Chinchilla lanigera]